MSFEIFSHISFKNQPMGAHQKFERPSPAHGFLFKKNRPMGWAGLGLAQPIRSSVVLNAINNNLSSIVHS